MKPQRPRNPRPRKMKLLVVCEGKSTEFTYLDGLCHEQGVQDRFAPQLRRGRGGDARVVVRSAINERDRQKHRDEAYEEVWCVLDVEGNAVYFSYPHARILVKVINQTNTSPSNGAPTSIRSAWRVDLCYDRPGHAKRTWSSHCSAGGDRMEGCVVALYITRAASAPMLALTTAHLVPGRGIAGDRFYARRGSEAHTNAGQSTEGGIALGDRLRALD